jgi:class I fructose-bisphosphate aldolase
MDITAYAAHLAAELGAHIIKVKPPSNVIFADDKDTKAVYEDGNWAESQLSERVAHVLQAAFNGRRIVIFSGGPAKGDDEVLEEIGQIAAGGGFGTIMGRNAFQRVENKALQLLVQVISLYEAASKSK